MTGIRLRTGAPRRAPAAPPPPPPTLRSVEPGAAAMRACLAAHAVQPRRSRLGDLVGLAPVRAEAAAAYERAAVERETATLLDRLPADWTVLHSVPLGDAVVPHLLVGPAGVVALFPQPQAAATVWVSEDLLAVDGAASAALAVAEAAVPAIGERLAAVLGRGIPIVPIVAFPGAERIVVRTPPRSTRVLGLEEVVPWLRALPEVCSAVLVDRIADAAALPGTWDAVVDPELPERFALLESELAASGRRWDRTVRVMTAASLALLAIGAAAGAAVFGQLANAG